MKMNTKTLKFDQEKKLVDLNWTTILAPSTSNPSEKVPVSVKTVLLELFMKRDDEIFEYTKITREDMIRFLKATNDWTLEITWEEFEQVKKLINFKKYDNIVYINIVDAFTA